MQRDRVWSNLIHKRNLFFLKGGNFVMQSGNKYSDSWHYLLYAKQHVKSVVTRDSNRRYAFSKATAMILCKVYLKMKVRYPFRPKGSGNWKWMRQGERINGLCLCWLRLCVCWQWLSTNTAGVRVIPIHFSWLNYVTLINNVIYIPVCLCTRPPRS